MKKLFLNIHVNKMVPFQTEKEHTFVCSGVKKTNVRYYIMEYNGFPVVRGRGMVKWNPFVNSTIIKSE
ncbi:hypothetical protein BC30048_2056 [Bacillus cereus]|nr:hypothetical protein BC30048_2056 [Bacillus cereus]